MNKNALMMRTLGVLGIMIVVGGMWLLLTTVTYGILSGEWKVLWMPVVWCLVLGGGAVVVGHYINPPPTHTNNPQFPPTGGRND